MTARFSKCVSIAIRKAAIVYFLTPALIINAVAILAIPARSQESGLGTASEAKTMLERAVLELKNNNDAAIETFNGQNRNFSDRDLFILCFRTEDGKIVANQSRPDDVAAVRKKLQLAKPVDDPKVAKAAMSWNLPAAEHYYDSMRTLYEQNQTVRGPAGVMVIDMYQDAIKALIIVRLRAAEEYVVSIARFDVDIRTLRDVRGKLFGEEMYRVAQSEQINEVLYTAPNFTSPGDQVKKGFYITRVGNYGCGVGYHR